MDRFYRSISEPWLDTQKKLETIAGLATLQGIGHVVNSTEPFSKVVTEALRVDLGDWRQMIDWTQINISDPVQRSSLYTERGLNQALAEIPHRAFEQGILAADIAYPQLQVSDEYSLIQEAESDCEENIEYNQKAYDLLFRFETQVRKFIDEEMTAAFGPGWEKHRVSGGKHKEWRQKRTNNKGDSGQALITYADFTDYLPIIVRNDNWDEVFETTFGRKESVQESFQRLYPVRLDTMHARLITQEDAIYLYAEVHRILGAIGIEV